MQQAKVSLTQSEEQLKQLIETKEVSEITLKNLVQKTIEKEAEFNASKKQFQDFEHLLNTTILPLDIEIQQLASGLTKEQQEIERLNKKLLDDEQTISQLKGELTKEQNNLTNCQEVFS